MQKNNNDKLKSITVLSVISLIAGILLAFAFQLTEITPEEKQQRINAKLNAIHNSAGGYVSVAYEGNSGIEGFYKDLSGEDYFIIISRARGYKGDIQLYVCFSGNNIINITAGKNGDTPGISDKALSGEYLDRYYVDINNAVFGLTKNGGDFDAASGATFTSKGVISAIKNAVDVYKSYLGEV